MRPIGWVILACVMLKAFELIDVSWWVTLTPLWFLFVLVTFQVLFLKEEKPFKKHKTFQQRLRDKQNETNT